MKMRQWFLRCLTGVVFGLLLACSGCSHGDSDTVTSDIGEFTVQDVNQLIPGDAPAMQRLASDLKANPKATTFIVTWKNVHNLGSTFSRIYIYDRKAGNFTDSSNNVPLYYQGVKDDFIQSLAASSGTADGLAALGARRVESLPEPAQ